MQRDVGPGALLRLIGGALRLAPETLRGAVAEPAVTRLYLAIVVLAAISTGVAYAMEAVASGLLAERDFGLSRLLVVVGVAETALQFLLFVAVVHVIRLVTRRPQLRFGALARLMALSLAPVCLVAIGPMLGAPEWVRGVLIAWRLVISVMALRVGAESSWTGALLTVLIADFVSAPLVSVALFGVVGSPTSPRLPA